MYKYVHMYITTRSKKTEPAAVFRLSDSRSWPIAFEGNKSPFELNVLSRRRIITDGLIDDLLVFYW